MASEYNQDGLGEFIRNGFGEQYLHSVNRDAFIKSGSDAIYARYFRDRLWNHDSLHIIVGTDSGLLPEYIQRHGLARGSRYLFVELPDILEKLTQAGRLGDLGNRMLVIPPDNWLEIAEQHNLLDYLFLDKAHVHLSLAAADAHIPEYVPLASRIEDEFNTRSWQLLQGQACGEFLDKIMLNLAENRIAFNSALDETSFAGYSAVLAAGGPSLDSMIPWIKAHRDEILLFAVSRICRRLHEVGLTPDIIVSIDPTHMSFEISKEMFAFSQDSLFINGNHVTEELIGQWPGKSLYLGNRYPWDTETNVSNTPVCGPSVTNSALMCAIMMGFKQIIFAGVDLCFTREGHSHALGSDERDAGTRIGHVGTQVKTNGGQMADTDIPFAQAVDAIGSQAVYARHFGCTCINPNPDAAVIKEVEHITLDQIQLTALPQPARKMLDERVPDETSAQRVITYQATLKELGRIRHRLEKVREIANDALAAHEKLFNPETAHEKYKKRIDKLEQQLDKEFERETLFIKKYGLKRFSRLARPDEDLEWTEEEIERTGRGYYQAYRDSINDLFKMFSAIETRLNARLQEESDTPDFGQLATQWRQDGQPGRALIWQKHSPAAFEQARTSHAAEIQQFEQDFSDMLSAENIEHNARAKKESRIEYVRAKATLQFLRQDTSGLQDLRNGLEKDGREEAAPYRSIVKGYLAELEQQDADALMAYQEVTDGPLLEDALKRIAYLTLKHQDLENAALALDCLAAISPSYLPQYADVMRIRGDIAQAAELYTLYLDHAPDDLAIAIRLGRLYQDNNINDVALQIFDYVLNKDPNNQAARQLRQQLENTA